MKRSPLYEQDFVRWTAEQSALLRSGQMADADIERIAEEIESMGKTEQREMESRLSVLLLHLLKWHHQPMRRGASWQATIRVQRRDLSRLIGANPSLKPLLAEAIAYGYENARIEAAAETGLPESAFPPACPWAVEEIMRSDFWPG